MPYTYDYPHPAVTTDVVVLTTRGHELKVLLIRRAQPPFKGKWALPGGFVNLDEGLEAGARRELLEETGVSGVFLEQLYTFGEPDRDPRERVISVAYYALVPSDGIEPEAGSDAAGVSWFGLLDLPALAFDHDRILAMAQQRLRAKLDHSMIAFRLMPPTFTLAELQQVYEAILDESIDKRNFRGKILARGVLAATGEEMREGPHRSAMLYRVIDCDAVETS